MPVSTTLSPGRAMFTMSPSMFTSKNWGSCPGGSSSGSSCILTIWKSTYLLCFLSSSKFLTSPQMSHLGGRFRGRSSWSCIVRCPLWQTQAASVMRGLSSDVLTTIPETESILSR